MKNNINYKKVNSRGCVIVWVTLFANDTENKKNYEELIL